MNSAKKPLLGLSAEELKNIATSLGLPSYTGGQMAKWLYEKHVDTIEEMTNLSKQARARLAEEYTLGAMAPISSQLSADGTKKYLFPVITDKPSPTGDTTKFVETVYIPDGERATLCVSCQVGCKMGCLFCQTGRQGFEGNLTVGDIVNQIYSVPEHRQLTNIVFMGQGEPMDNLDSILAATRLLTSAGGYAWSPKRITVSTVGVRGKLETFLNDSQCHVAVSMHSPFHEERLRLMPAERAMPLGETIALLRKHGFTHQRRCSFEYICFGRLNDSERHAAEIARLLKGIECRVNLIRFHKMPDIDLPPTDAQRMEQMRDYLTAHGIHTTIRASRGEDILAACGLLSTAHKKQQE